MQSRLLILLFALPVTAGAIQKSTIAMGNWSNPVIWSPAGVPLPGDQAHLYHEVTLDVSITISDTIFVYDVLNLAKNKILTLSPGILIIVNDAQYSGRIGTVANNANIVGNYEFRKFIVRCDGFSTYGSPFTKPVSDFDWYYCNKCMDNWSNLHYYDETVPGTLDQGYTDQTGGNIARGRGFFYWFKNYSGGKNFPRTIALKGSTDFAAGFSFGINWTSSGGTSSDGFNLLANPYPGTIDWLSQDWMKKKINNALYVWNSCTASYASFAGGVGVNGGSRYIPAMQGFWVQANAASPALSAGPGALVSASQPHLRAGEEEVPRVLRITLGEDEIAVRQHGNSSRGFDSETDALKMVSESSRLFTSTDSNDFSINAVSMEDQCIELRTRGTGKLTFSGSRSFPEKYIITLVDHSTGERHKISDTLLYSFSDTATATFARRFSICFSEKSEATFLSESESEQFMIATFEDHLLVSFSSALEFFVTAHTLTGEAVNCERAAGNSFIVRTKGLPLLIRAVSQEQICYRKIMPR